MKLRRTVYPVALIVAIPLVLLVIYVLNQGEFVLEKEDTVQGHLEDGGDYVAYPITWQGYGNPIIETILSNEEVTLYISENVDDQLEPIENIQLKSNQFYLVIKTADKKVLHNTTVEIRYKTFGINRKQGLLIK